MANSPSHICSTFCLSNPVGEGFAVSVSAVVVVPGLVRCTCLFDDDFSGSRPDECRPWSLASWQCISRHSETVDYTGAVSVPSHLL